MIINSAAWCGMFKCERASREGRRREREGERGEEGRERGEGGREIQRIIHVDIISPLSLFSRVKKVALL